MTSTMEQASGADSVITARGLTKRFGDAVALAGVDLEVRRGELVVLVGLSGSGKSTLLRCLNGLHPPSSGEVDVLGCRVDDARPARLRRLRSRIGFVFQQFNLVGRLSCLENVLIGALGRVRGPRYGVLSYPLSMRREALDHLDRVGLADRAFQRADTLSGGQQQRVAIARTLMHRPALLLADEPVASLDPENAAVVMDLLFQVSLEEQLTVVCSLHQVDLALGWAHRLVGLREGSKVLDRSASSMTRDDVMQVYQRVDPAQVPEPRTFGTGDTDRSNGAADIGGSAGLLDGSGARSA
ncbi:phosphonate ABC transporter ATP-binding protein [Phytoactinopolyspora endophytica]|uniref:phosphonate ABC transporter ATP-binding protein n=1 Tax=Phytoactinopolyspora endophytica TaxID=1642495 RepID=UPI00197C763D|nr:phosphonate ABC transporter ATP-binding protein [Phytoactinopolyspora endophytica]